MYLPTSTSYN